VVKMVLVIVSSIHSRGVMYSGLYLTHHVQMKTAKIILLSWLVPSKMACRYPGTGVPPPTASGQGLV